MQRGCATKRCSTKSCWCARQLTCCSLRLHLLTHSTAQVVGKTYCPYTKRAKAAITELGCTPAVMDVDVLPNGDALQSAFAQVSGIKTVPQVFVAGRCVGGCDATLAAIRDGSFQRQLREVGVPVSAS